jgi:methionine-rich copper-binding protein CopC
MNSKKLSRIAVPIVITLVTIVRGASAHSFPEEEIPSAGATVAAPPAQVTIKYDAPIEKLFDSLQVLNAAGQDKAAGAPQVSADGHELSVSIAPLSPGEYTVKWRVVCIDTHHTEGSYSFTVQGNNK